MPRLQDIELFKRDLAALSHEAEVLERWGEKPEAITPPEGAAAAPEAAAPSRAAARPETARAPERKPPKAEDGTPPDFADLLESLPLGSEEGGEESAEGSSLDAELAALLGETAPPSAPPPEEIPEAIPEAEAAGETEPAIDFGELPGLGAMPEFGAEPSAPETALPEAEPAVAEAAEPSSEAEAPEAEAPAESFEGFSFEMPEFGDEAAKPAEREEAPEEAPEEALPLAAEGLEESAVPEGAAEAPAEAFSIPEFDLGGEEPSPAPREEPAAEAFDSGFSIPELEDRGEPEEAAEAPAPEPGPAGGSGGQPDLGADAFESFTFEEPGAAPEPGLADFGTPAAQDLDTEIASLSEEAPIADTFKIDQDWGGFGGFGAETGREAPPKAPPPPRPSARPKAAEEKFKPVALTEAQVDRLQDSLLSYPLNLRVAIEDVIANAKGSEAQQSKLVWSLVEGASAEDAAALAGRILKRHIPIPKGREKRTGAALEAERGTLAYAFVHTFLPVVKIGLLVLAATLAVGYLGWRYVYVPLAADSLYRTGYQRIAEDRYPEAETSFAKATAMKEFVAWYYRYAEAYAAKRQYILAEKKYASLVAAHPKETKGILAWARLEKDQLKFEEAVDVLKGAPRKVVGEAAVGKTGLLSWDYFNKDGLLLLGDVYLDWGEEDKAKYEDARGTYATLLERYGDEDVYLERMLLYFIRVDKLKEVLPLEAHFLADPKKTALDALVLAELGGYLLDKDRLEDVREMLLSAAKKDPTVPEAHYNLARYFRRAGDPTEERKALEKSVNAFSALPGMGGRRTGMYIDSLIWRGRFLAGAGEWVGAEQDYAAAAKVYEKGLELRRIARSGRFGEAYAGLGDVAYLKRDDGASALAYYDKAEANGYVTKDTCYRRGNILYRAGRYADSLERFYEAQGRGGASPYLDYAFGAAFEARSDLFAAEACFRRAAAAMAKQLADQGEPAPQERPSQVEILGLYLRAENNLAAALYRSAARSGDARRRNEAMAAFTRAARLYEQLSQEPAAFNGPESGNLAVENMNALLKPGKAQDLRVYTLIEKDMDFPRKPSPGTAG